MDETACYECGAPFSDTTSGIGTGYGRDADGHKVCYYCCAELDLQRMRETGKITLYLSRKDDGVYYVTNWPGTLQFRPSSIQKGRHNIARTRTDAWFTDQDGLIWHGVQYGEWTQILHCRRTKVHGMQGGPQWLRKSPYDSRYGERLTPGLGMM